MPIILRNAEDDFFALVISNAAEEAGAKVVSITYDGQGGNKGQEHSRFLVWIRTDNEVLVDEYISKKFIEIGLGI